MSQDSKIEWTDDTVNPWWGCVKVSRACKNCYAEGLDNRYHAGAHWGPTAPRLLRVEKAIGELERIARRGEKEGRPRRVFIASMSDFFEDRDDLVEPRARVWEALHRLDGRLIPMLLTKRPEVMAAWAESHGWPTSAWAMTTVEDQPTADERVPHLLKVPARVRGLSVEPMAGPIDASRWLTNKCRHECHCEECCTEHCPMKDGDYSRIAINWVIAGGESGPKAAPSHPDWFRSLRAQCDVLGVPFFFKQWGEHRPAELGEWGPHASMLAYDGRQIAVHERFDPVQGDALLVRVGKHAAGRLLDGREWSEVPS